MTCKNPLPVDRLFTSVHEVPFQNSVFAPVELFQSDPPPNIIQLSTVPPFPTTAPRAVLSSASSAQDVPFHSSLRSTPELGALYPPPAHLEAGAVLPK